MKIAVKHIIVLVFLGLSTQLSAAEALGWKNSLVSGFYLSQTGVKDWQQGGDNNLSWRGNLQGNFVKTTLHYTWQHQLKLTYGSASVSGESTRKTVDEIYYNTVYTFRQKPVWNPYVGASVLTQFTESYDYSTSPKTAISNFMDPGFLTQSAGISFKPADTLALRSGLSIKETITNDHTEYSDGDRFKVDTGLEFVIDYNKKFNDISKLTSKLELFSNLQGVDEVDYNWDSTVTVKASKYVDINMNLKLVYDKDVIDTQQVKSFLGIGLSYTLI